VPLLFAVESSFAAQPAQWSAPKAARAAAQAHRLAAGDSEAPAEINPAADVERVEPAVSSADGATTRPIVVIMRPGDSIPPELQALLNQAPAKLSAPPNGPAPHPIPTQPQSRLQGTTTAANTPASASVPAAAPLSSQLDPAQAGERRPAHSDPLLPSSANIQAGQGGIFKWPSGMRLEYADPPQPPPQSPMAKRTKALFRQSLETPPVEQTGATPPKAKALFSRTSAPTPEAMPGQGLATAQPAKPKALLPGGKINYPNLGISNPGSPGTPATPLVHNAPPRAVTSSMPAEQTRALFAPRPDGRGFDEAMLDWFQASDTSSRALFSQSTRLPAPTTAVQTAAAASANAAPAQPVEPPASQPTRSKALFSKSLWPKPAEPDPLLKYIPRDHEPNQASATAAIPAATASGNPKNSKALFPREMFVRSRQQPPGPPAVAPSAPTKSGPTLARVPAAEESIQAPQLLAEPARQAVNRAEGKSSSASGMAGKQPGGNLNPSAVERPAGPRDWRPSNRRPKAARNSVASAATAQGDSSSGATGVSLAGSIQKQLDLSREIQASDTQTESGSADAASASKKDAPTASEPSREGSSPRKRNPLR
jgi:hypothetical protein